MRTFVAIRLPGGLIERLKALTAGLKKEVSGASWVRPENVHLTLKFLGEVDPSKRGVIVEALKGAAAPLKPFTLSTLGIGGFPNLLRPRVLWVGMAESEELTRLYTEIEAHLAGAGFKKEDRRFRPHLTICRLKTRESGLSAARAVARLGAGGGGKAYGEGNDAGAVDISVDFPVGSFVLFKSVLGPGGAKHIPLETITLGGQ